MRTAGRAFAAVSIALGMGLVPLAPVAYGNEADAAIVMKDVAIVTTARAERREIVARVPVTGSLVARQPVQVHANVSGYEIRDIRADIGDSVKAGDVLVTLDSESLSAQLAQAEAEFARASASVSQAENQIASTQALLKQAGSQLERTQSLRRSGNAAQSALDDVIATEAAARAAAASASDGLAVAKAQLAQADAARRIADLNLRHTRVLAPVDGVIVARRAEIGALSGSSEAMFIMVARGEIEMAADVIGSALAQIAPGDPAELELAGGGRVEGKVRLVPAAVDPETRLGIARISLESDPRLRVGLFLSGWIVTDRRQALTVPAMAVLSDDEGDRVQIVRDGVVETRPVKAGLIWEGRREILEGISAGDEVIARAGVFFRSGDRVRPLPQATGAVPDIAGKAP